MDNLSKSIVATICYFDIFDYPVTEEEAWKYLHTKTTVSKKAVKQILWSNRLLGKQDGYFFLRGRDMLVAKRKAREQESTKKILIAKQAARLLSLIPFLSLVGISGSVAMQNADKNDDIDLFIVTKPGTVWITRLVSTLLLDVFSVRRKRGDGNVDNKICLNMFLDEQNLQLAKEDIYTAHEIIQLKPIFDRYNVYGMLQSQNDWIQIFLGNSNKKKHMHKTYAKMIPYLLLPIERTLQDLQMHYMQGHRTREVLTSGVLAFHPQDARESVLRRYRKRLKKYEI